jgi:hypothetical protein
MSENIFDLDIYKPLNPHSYKWGRSERTPSDWLIEIAVQEQRNVQPGYPNGNPVFAKWAKGEAFTQGQYSAVLGIWNRILSISEKAQARYHAAREKGLDDDELSKLESNIIVVACGSGKYRSYRCQSKVVNAGQRPSEGRVGGYEFDETNGGIMFDVPVMHRTLFIEEMANRMGIDVETAEVRFKNNRRRFIHHGGNLWSGKGIAVRNPSPERIAAARDAAPKAELTYKQKTWWTMLADLQPGRYACVDEEFYPDIEKWIKADPKRMDALEEIRSGLRTKSRREQPFRELVGYLWKNRNNFADSYAKGRGPTYDLPSGKHIGKRWYDRQLFRNSPEQTWDQFVKWVEQVGYPIDCLEAAAYAAAENGDLFFIKGEVRKVVGAGTLEHQRNEYEKRQEENLLKFKAEAAALVGDDCYPTLVKYFRSDFFVKGKEYKSGHPPKAFCSAIHRMKWTDDDGNPCTVKDHQIQTLWIKLVADGHMIEYPASFMGAQEIENAKKEEADKAKAELEQEIEVQPEERTEPEPAEPAEPEPGIYQDEHGIFWSKDGNRPEGWKPTRRKERIRIGNCEKQESPTYRYLYDRSFKNFDDAVQKLKSHLESCHVSNYEIDYDAAAFLVQQQIDKQNVYVSQYNGSLEGRQYRQREH